MKVLSEYPEAKMTSTEQEETYQELVKKLDEGISTSSLLCFSQLSISTKPLIEFGWEHLLLSRIHGSWDYKSQKWLWFSLKNLPFIFILWKDKNENQQENTKKSLNNSTQNVKVYDSGVAGSTMHMLGMGCSSEALHNFEEGPPFTLQRLCEILLAARRIYPNLSKLALALEKVCLLIFDTLLNIMIC
ncbi:hypothetical protein DKX38_029322 [Salix brachista]|uniref:Uncharacterized protein n=1 Tax=Salix brachista TaxID=2182728 RepID=A0A5N5J3A8_9ROSI|nr:hypothetical protein DKX38_029322 [Salix brachista]